MISDADTDPRPSRDDSTSGSAGERDCSSLPPVALPDSDALFLDVDGTLLHIERHPDAVQVPQALLESLDRLSARFGGAVALVSGRSIADLDRLFAPLRLPCAGIHGLERRSADAAVHRAGADGLLEPLRPQLVAFAAAHAGLLLEDKGQSLALHFRNAPDAGPAAEVLLRRLIADSDSALELKRGKMVLEVKPGHADKGTAITAFMREPPFAGRRPVFVGDDVTDEDGFAAVNSLGGLSVRVGFAGESAAVHRLADEEAVHAWLRACGEETHDREAQ